MSSKQAIRLIILVLFCLSQINAVAQDYQSKVDVLHYNINLDITDFASRQIKGFTTVKMLVKDKASKEFGLDLLQLTCDSVIVNGAKIQKFTHRNELINFATKNYKLGDTLMVTVYYHGEPAEDKRWGGFFINNESAINYGVGMEATPPCYGRAWFPCIDNFTDKATYEFHITTAKSNTAVCSGIFLSVSENNQTKTWNWVCNQNIPTYIASVAVADFAAYKTTYNNLPIACYVPKKDKNKATGSFSTVDDMVRIFEERFGKYRWDRVGFVAVPFASGAMEHAMNIAIPNYSITGDLGQEMLLAHELSHAWFGNLVTCEAERDMWLNEGWASYCEAVYVEGMYGKEAFRNYTRNTLALVLNQVSQSDGNIAIYGISHDDTYSQTVYKKGSVVVHTLRGYMGDSLFFSAVKQYLNQYAYSNITTQEFCRFLSDKSGINLDEFFKFWVYSPGFTHFAIDSTTTQKSDNNYVTTIYVKQRLKNAPQFAQQNRIPISFWDENLNRIDRTIEFSGETAKQSFNLPFEPKLTTLDPDGWVADATLDNYAIIEKTGTYPFKDTGFELTLSTIANPVFVRPEFNLLAPLSPQNNPEIEAISDYYWHLDIYSKSNFQGKGRFTLANSEGITAAIQKNLKPILIYRQSNGKWTEVEAVYKSSGNTRYFETSQVKNGEYAIGCVR